MREEPRIDYFRHHEAKAAIPEGQFEDWPESDINRKMTKLVDVICAHEMYGIVSGLKLQTHFKAFEGSVLSPKQLHSVLRVTHPYEHCFFAVTSDVLQIEQERGTGDKQVDFIFDEQTGLLPKCIKLYREMKSDFPEEKRAIAGTVSEANDKRVPALQAADFLVGQMTTQFRLPEPEIFFQRMVSCHTVHSSRAYPPNFEAIPDIVSALNVAWSTKRLTKAAK